MRKLFYVLCFMLAGFPVLAKTKFYSANNPLFRYTGRVDFTKPEIPRFYAPGVYVEVGFEGSYCELWLNDEELYGKYHNYITVVIDGGTPQRIKLKQKENRIIVGDKLSEGKHQLLICKGTEAGIGYIDFVGIRCEKLLPAKPAPVRKIEFIGNSITCGMGSNSTALPCGEGDWYDQSDAYQSYGAITARTLNSGYHLSSVSGIGLMHSCCDHKFVMPQLFDKINFRDNELVWDFSRYQPDVLSICLGQNDGIQDSATFAKNYLSFIANIRKVYPNTTIVCLSSPMADAKLATFMQAQLSAIVKHQCQNGDKNIYYHVFEKQYQAGCSYHPSVKEHYEIAAQLSAFIKKIKGWN